MSKSEQYFQANNNEGETKPDYEYPEESIEDAGFEFSENLEVTEGNTKPNLWSTLEYLIHNFEKTDVEIKIDGMTFRCHRLVLRCYSEYFKDLGNDTEVILPSNKVSADAFVMIYTWMLDDKPQIQREGIIDLFTAAVFLKIKQLIHQCWSCFDDDRRFSEYTAFFLYLEARNFGHSSIQELMIPRISKFFLPLVACKEFVELSVDEVCCLLQSNFIAVNSEIEVFLSGVRWLCFDWNNREEYLINVMECVRFGLFTAWQLVELRKNTGDDYNELQLIVNHHGVAEMIDNGLFYVTAKYWYMDYANTFLEHLKKINLTQPAERQWIRDKFCPNALRYADKMDTAYDTFLEYLKVIRDNGENHWKSITFVTRCEDKSIQVIKTNKSPQWLVKNETRTSFDYKVQPKVRHIELKPNRNGVKSIFTINSKRYLKSNHTNRKKNVSKMQGLRKKQTNKILCANKSYLKIKNNLILKQAQETKSNHSDKPSQAKNDELKYGTKMRGDSHENNAENVHDIKKKIVRYVKNFSENKPTNKMDSSLRNQSKDIECKLQKYYSAVTEINLTKPTRILVFGGIDPFSSKFSDSFGKLVLQYETQKNKWKPYATMPGLRHHHQIALRGNKLYVVGGAQPASQNLKLNLVRTMWNLDLNRFEWVKEKDLPFSRRDFGLVASSLGIHVIGGQNRAESPTKTHIFYSYEEEKWIFKTPLKVERSGLAACLVRNHIWIAGGIQSKRLTDRVECYNIQTDTWMNLGRLRYPTCFGKLCFINSEIYMIGGLAYIDNAMCSLSSVDKYFVEDNEWKEVARMSTERHGHDITVIENKIYISGGVSSILKSALSSVECLSTVNYEWIKDISPMPIPLSGHASVAIY